MFSSEKCVTIFVVLSNNVTIKDRRTFSIEQSHTRRWDIFMEKQSISDFPTA